MPHADTNGHTTTHSAQPVGVYAPLNVFFDKNDELDLDTFKRHALRVAQAGVGLVVNGSMGESHHLSREERRALVAAARQVVDENGLTGRIQVIAGAGGNSTRDSILYCKDAAEAGADSTMVITPGYFAGALSSKAIKTFFVDVAAASPIPVIVYNYPGASAGIDLSSDLITEIAAEAPNIIGVKLTCGAVGKLSRLVSLRPDFAVLAGFIDIMGPGIMMGSKGAITGLANVAPKSCAKLYELTVSGVSGNAKDLQAAVKFQELVSAADWTMCKGGISGTKAVLERLHGYGGIPRRPILTFEEEGKSVDTVIGELKELLAYEKSL